MNHIEVGQLGEEIALNYLKKRKFKHISKNYRKKYGEIDLIFKKDGILYFIEVKAKKEGLDKFQLLEKIHSKKIKRLERAIHVYLSENNLLENQVWRLSAFLIGIDEYNHKAEIHFIENLY